ncbi:MAG TPA: tetratricopeptide repeat protein [Acidobacteriota bacterium]|nr:tetratricopeptide repeat protein [Acidobacteriota bacterium]
MLKIAIVGTLVLGFFLPLFAQEATGQEQQTEQAQPLAESKPAAAAGDFDVAMKHYRQRHYGRAVEEFQRVIDADPNNAAAHYFMGYAHYVMGHHQEALAAFKKCFETDPKFDPRPYWSR